MKHHGNYRNLNKFYSNYILYTLKFVNFAIHSYVFYCWCSKKKKKKYRELNIYINKQKDLFTIDKIMSESFWFNLNV